MVIENNYTLHTYLHLIYFKMVSFALTFSGLHINFSGYELVHLLHSNMIA